MDDKPQTGADDEDETVDSAASGPLGKLVEQELGSSTAESEDAAQTLNKPSQPRTISPDYAAGTREHDDDRE